MTIHEGITEIITEAVKFGADPKFVAAAREHAADLAAVQAAEQARQAKLPKLTDERRDAIAARRARRADRIKGTGWKY